MDKKNELHIKKEIFIIPNRIKKEYVKMDPLTIQYLREMEEEIGLLSIQNKWKNPLFAVNYRYPLFWNEATEGHAFIGKIGQRWIAQIVILADGMQYDVVRCNFSDLPTAETVLVANTLNQVYAYARSVEKNRFQLYCSTCNSMHHWLETPGDVHQKWQSLKNQQSLCE